MNHPYFSIIIPTYNRAKFIEKTIHSVLNQRFQDFELIIVDDGSTDHTKDVVNQINDPRINYYYKKNGERAAARNFGILRAKGEYISFLDSDDYYYPTYLANAFESLKKYDLPEFLFIGYESVSNAGIKIRKFNFLNNDDYSAFIKGNPMSCLGLVLKKSVFETHLFNEDRELSGSEDWEFLVRVISHFGFKVDKRISSALVRNDENSVFNMNIEKLYKRKKASYDYAFEDENVKKLYGPYKKEIWAYMLSYISLHAALSSNKKGSGFYLFKAINTYPKILFSMRTAVIIKRILLN